MPTNNNKSKKNKNNTRRNNNNNSKLLKNNNTIEIVSLLVIIVIVLFIIQNKKQKEKFKSYNSLENQKYKNETNTKTNTINIPSRGISGSFQQIGALYKENIESENQKSGNNNDSVVLALYGKQTYPRSRKWTYYTSSDANHQIKMPLTYKGQKCDSQCGCDEIMNDDLLTIPGYNGGFRTVIYDYDAPKYIPCV